MRVIRAVPEPMTRADRVRAHGADPISYSTLQPGLRLFETSFGFLAYHRAFGFDLTLGPPVCAPEDRASVIQAFLKAKRRPIFFYLPSDVAHLAAQLGGRRFHLCGMGVDKVVPLDEPRLETWAPRVDGALRKAAKARFTIEEVRLGALGLPERLRMEEITRRFLSRSAVPVQMHFLNRPLEWEDDGLARVFVLRQGPEARLFGYVALDPYFREGKVHGYLLNLLRCEPTRLWGVYYATVATLAARLRAEGAGELSLGYCPLLDVDTEGASPLLARQVRWMERRFAQVTYLARLKELKEAFTGPTPQRYFVAPSALAPATLLPLLHACRVPFAWMVGPQLFKAIWS